MKLKVLDLFSGIGGFSLGLERTGGFETVAFCEIDPFCQSVLKKHWPEVLIFNDIKKLEYDGPIDIITSGDPCQKDSRANASRNGASMWPYAFEQIKRHKPFFVLRENVSGNIETGTLATVEGNLKSENYQVRTYNIPSRSIGAAHDRPRTWTLAYSDCSRREKLDDATKPSKEEQRKYPVLVGPDGLCWMGTESPVLRRVDDVPRRVDRIRSLGNAVNNEIVMQFGYSIIEYWNQEVSGYAY